MKTKMSKENIDKEFETMALLITLHGVRNTIIETYHSKGKISDLEMKNFNKEVVNKIYSLLQILLNPYYKNDKKKLFENNNLYLPSDWDEPKFDKDFINLLKKIKSI